MRDDDLYSLPQGLVAPIDDGECEWFLGMSVKQDYEEIVLSQKDFVCTITEEYPQANKTNSPADPKERLVAEGKPADKSFPY